MHGLVLVLSIIAQFTAAFIAIRQLRSKGVVLGWTAIAIALFLMGARRTITLWRFLAGDLILPDLLAESVALLISILMLVGIARLDKAVLALIRARKVEAALKEKEELLGDILDNVTEGIITIAEDGTIESFNRAAEDLFGVTESEACGCNVDTMMPDPYRVEHDSYIHRYLKTGEGKIIGRMHREVVGTRANGSQFPLELGVSTMTVAGKQRFIGVLRDLTHRKAIEAQLRQAQKLESIGHLTGGVAHDFNNLLTVLIGNLELLSTHVEGNPKAKQQLDAAMTASLRGAELTRRLLAFSRKQDLHAKSTKVNELVRGQVALMKRTLGESIRINTDLDDELWEATIDASQLESALLNLAINARDAMPTGGNLTIETRNVRIDETHTAPRIEIAPGPYIMVAVTDTGTGMPPDVIEHAFDPFFTTKEVGKGSGLGLSMVHGFLKQSRGHIELFSEEGQGTTFKLYLPRTTSNGQAEQEKKPESHADEETAGDECILVVEDDPSVRALVVILLDQLGYQVLEAQDGPMALALLEKFSEVDLLLTDVILPKGMNGPQLAERVREQLPQVKVLYTSGYTKNAIVRESTLDGRVEILAKPYSTQDLANTVRRVLDQQESVAPSLHTNSDA